MFAYCTFQYCDLIAYGDEGGCIKVVLLCTFPKCHA